MKYATGTPMRRHSSVTEMAIPSVRSIVCRYAGVVKTSRNPQAAVKLIEFLASPSGGRGYAEANNEYPLRGTGNNPILKRFGPFQPDGVSAEQMGAKNKAAVQLMARNGWK